MPDKQSITLTLLWVGSGEPDQGRAVETDDLPSIRFCNAGAAVRQTLSAVVEMGHDADMYTICLEAEGGMWIRVCIDMSDRTAQVEHIEHSLQANAAVEVLSESAEGTTVMGVLAGFRLQVLDGTLSGQAISRHFDSEVMPIMRRWKEALVKRDELDMKHVDSMAKLIECSTDLRVSLLERTPGPIEESLDYIFASDNPLTTVLHDDRIWRTFRRIT